MTVKRVELQNNLAMTVTIVMGSMLFATLFMGYAIYRSNSLVWPPLGIPKVSLLVPTISSMVISLSSWFLFQVRKRVQANNYSGAHEALNISGLLGILFVISQIYLWYSLKQTGIFIGTSGIFGSVMYGFTWIHAFHVLMGLGALLYLKIVLKPITPYALQKTINVEKFWHFLGVVWLIMYLTMFVL